MKILYAFPVLLIAASMFCHAPLDATVWNDAGPAPLITNASLRDTLPPGTYSRISPTEINGVRLDYDPGTYTAYFEYRADPTILLAEIERLPFSLRGIADTALQPVTPQSVLDDRPPFQEQLSFFFANNPHDFTAYECRRWPYTHTILIQQASDRILHRIEKVM